MISRSRTSTSLVIALVAGCFWLVAGWVTPVSAQESPDALSAEEVQLIREVENQRIKVIEQVVGSVIAIYGPSRQGGGSGVIIDSSGIALTNHHVIEGAGMH